MHRSNILLATTFILFLLFSACDDANIVTYQLDPTLPDHDLERNDAVDFGVVSDDIGYNDESSVLLTKSSPYGITATLNNLDAGTLLEFSLWKTGDFKKVNLVIEGDWGYYHDLRWLIDWDSDWACSKFRVKIPEGVKTHKVRCFAHYFGNDTAYVDNMTITKVTGSAVAEKEPETLVYLFYPLLYELLNEKAAYNNIPDTFSPDAFMNGNELVRVYEQYQVAPKHFKAYFNEIKLTEKEIIKELARRATEIAIPEIGYKWKKEMERFHEACRTRKGLVFDLKDSILLYPDTKFELRTLHLYRMEPGYKSTEVARGGPMLIADQLGKGFYFGALTPTPDPVHSVPFIISDFSKNEVVILAPVTTWHAYNNYGGKSFYSNGIDKDDVTSISINRANNSIYLDNTPLEHDLYVLKNIYDWFATRYPTTVYPDYYLEKHPELFENTKTIVLAQHCEYFSPDMYKNLEDLSAYRNLISMGANQIYWKVRWHDDYTRIECRKAGELFEGTHIPGGKWRTRYSNEARILGVAYTDAGASTYSSYQLNDPDHWLLNGVNSSATFGIAGMDNHGASGDETDKMNSSSPANTELIAIGNNPDKGGGHLIYINRESLGTLSTGSISSGSSLGVDSTFTGIIRNFMIRHHDD